MKTRHGCISGNGGSTHQGKPVHMDAERGVSKKRQLSRGDSDKLLHYPHEKGCVVDSPHLDRSIICSTTFIKFQV